MDIVLTDDAVKAVRDKPDLYSDVSKVLGVAPTYLAVLLRKKDSRLTQMAVLQTISIATGTDVKELVQGTKGKPVLQKVS